MSELKTALIQTKVSPTLHRAIKLQAEREASSVSTVVRRVLKTWFQPDEVTLERYANTLVDPPGPVYDVQAGE
jgi:hypothetical protein